MPFTATVRRTVWTSVHCLQYAAGNALKYVANDTVERAANRSKVRKARDALHFGCLGIDGHRVVAGFRQYLEHVVAGRLARARNARHGDCAPGEECSDGRGYGDHGSSIVLDTGAARELIR